VTDDRSPLITLALAGDHEYFEQLRGIPKSECNRCKTDENVTPGPVIPGTEGGRRREMRCSRCDFGWSVAVEEAS
jgi:hypothetical protein